MRAAARKLRVLMATQIAHMTAYRAEIVIWMLSGTLSLIMMLIWMAQARQAQGGEIGGYDAQAFASYFLATWLTGQLLVVWVAWELDMEIRLGQLSPKLLRPLDPFWQHYAAHIAERFVRVPLMLVVLALFALLAGARFSSDPRVYLAYLGLTVLGFSMRFLAEYCSGLIAFWTDSATSFSELFWLVYAALGGLFAPMAFYPQWVQDIARFTPFPYMLGLPASLLAGKATLAQAGQGALVLGAWLAGLFVLRLVLWRTGLRKYGAVGA